MAKGKKDDTKIQTVKDQEPTVRAHSDKHREVIDEYYNNGFNKVKAGMTVCPNMAYTSAGAYVTKVFKDERNQAYIEAKQKQIKESANIKTEQILRELITLAYSDITDFIDLSLEDIKSLPPEVRRCIGSIDIKTTTYLPRGAVRGEEVTEQVFKIKLIDKLKSIDMINKYIGFYSEDNKQKKATVNLENVSVDNLNVLLQVASDAIKQG